MIVLVGLFGARVHLFASQGAIRKTLMLGWHSVGYKSNFSTPLKAPWHAETAAPWLFCFQAPTSCSPLTRPFSTPTQPIL